MQFENFVKMAERVANWVKLTGTARSQVHTENVLCLRRCLVRLHSQICIRELVNWNWVIVCNRLPEIECSVIPMALVSGAKVWGVETVKIPMYPAAKKDRFSGE